MMINTEWYRIFLHAAESENLTKAAQSLHITQPSVSYAIKQLEESLGVRLFDRLSKGVRLTQEGKTMYQHVRQAFEELQYAEHYMKKLGQLSDGRLRIGANGAIIKDYLLPTLDAFRSHYSDIRAQLSQERTSLILEQLKQGVLDIGYVYLPISDDDIEVVTSYSVPYCVVVGVSFGNLTQGLVPTEQLAELPFLMLSPGSTTRTFIEGWFQSQGMKIAADFELNSLDMLAEFAERGYGVAFLPRAYVASRIMKGTLLELKTEVPLPDRNVGVVIHKHSSPSLAAEAFLKMM